VTGVRDITNKKHLVTEILVTFSGAVNAGEAQSLSAYRLAYPGKRGSYTAKNAKVIKLESASYDAATDTVTLLPKKPFALTKEVQLLIDGVPPSGLQDIEGRYIAGGGQPGSNAVAILYRGGAAVDAAAAEGSGGGDFEDAVDFVLEQDAIASALPFLPGRKSRSS
jgi:hypothetical protein